MRSRRRQSAPEEDNADAGLTRATELLGNQVSNMNKSMKQLKEQDAGFNERLSRAL